MIRIMNDFCLWELIEDSRNYKMILYADAQYVQLFQKLLKLIDVEIAYYIADDENSASIYDLLYEEQGKFMVIVVSDDFYSVRIRLEDLGLQLGVNFRDIQYYKRMINLMPYHYDPVLGYNLDTEDEETRGFRIFGNWKDTGVIRILTLGGSTTDAYTLPHTWSEYLHEILKDQKIDNVVICGGVSSYTSAGELFKLIRDGFALRPDIVLNYSGFNDIGLPRCPYINSYMRQMSSYLGTQSQIDSVHFDQNKFGVSWGVNGGFEGTVQDDYLFWINNQKMIHAVCSARNVSQMTFLQPSLFNGKKKLSQTERSYQHNLVYSGVNRILTKDFSENVKEFCLLSQADAGKLDWLYDLSEIFYDQDVYFDSCHVNELGNRIIAEKIVDIVKPYLSNICRV